MTLATVSDRLSTTPVEGWNGSAWVSDVAFCDFQVFDRFISARDFGQKKRTMYCGPSFLLPTTYRVIRLLSSEVYIVTSTNMDIHKGLLTGATYFLTEASTQVDINSTVTTKSASGVITGSTTNTVSGVFADISRMGEISSHAMRSVKYSTHILTFPLGTVINEDDEVVDGADVYDINEVTRVLDSVEARGIQRGG